MSLLPNIIDKMQYLYQNVNQNIFFILMLRLRAGAGVGRVTDTPESEPQTAGVCSPVYTRYFIDVFVGFL